MILSYSRKRRQIYFLLYASGISQSILRLRTRQQPLVLMAHRVLEARDPVERLLVDSKAAISKDDFERRIRFLVRHFRPVTMADYLAGTAGPNSFVLTFDDGYRDNFTLALPVLRHYHVPMHIFVTTGFVNGQAVSWVDRIAQACVTAASGNYRIASLGFELCFTAPADRCAGFDQLCQSLKLGDLSRIEKALADIESLPGIVPFRDCDGLFLSQAELAAADNLVSYGAHSITHANFRLLDRATIEVEAEGSRKWLEIATGQPVQTFAYPYGFASECSRDYFRQTFISQDASWRHVFATGSGHAGDPLEDKRLNLNLQPFYVFHVEISGAWAILRQALWR